MGLSIRAYARQRGVSHVAVMKAIDAGRITQEENGSIDPVRADRDWAQNTVSPRSRSSMQNQATAPARKSSPESIAPNLSVNGTSLLQARTVNEGLSLFSEQPDNTRQRSRDMQDELTDEQILDVMRLYAQAGKTLDAYRTGITQLLDRGLLARSDRAP